MRSSTVIAAIVTLLSTTPRDVTAGPNELYIGKNVLAPIGHTVFCVRYPHDCSRWQGTLSFFTAEPADLYAELYAVNREVNGAIQPVSRTKKQQGETTLSWTLFPSLGNCNDYAVSKRHRLLLHGWPSSALQLAEVVLPTGEHHLVLLADAMGAIFVLDNLASEPVPLADVIVYRWIRIESPDQPEYWSSISFQKASN
jgi:predicted transglutaminase-like cysteine proteinase